MLSINFQVLAGSLLGSLWLIRLVISRVRRRSINHLAGPPPGSWLVGNTAALISPKEIGDADFFWIKEYGTTLHVKHTFGEDSLWTADPKAIQYIFNTSGYNYLKPNRIGVEMLLGRGLVWAEGSQHARQRKIMNPAFSFTALRGFLPLFRQTAQRAVNKLKDDKFAGAENKVINIMPWLSLITLDAIGETAFGYQFDAVQKGNESKLAAAYENLMTDAFSNRSDISVAIEQIFERIPVWLVHLILRLPIGRFKRLCDYLRVAREVAQDIVDKQTALYMDGKEGSKDVMSILVRANLSQDPKSKLSAEEIIPQMTTLFLAGHDTTALTSTWAIHQLSRHPEFQQRIRDEIKATRAAARDRGDTELTVADLDSMKCLLAVMKETLRFHPIVPLLVREAARDDIIPLSIPQKTKTGEIITSVPISKGQHIELSLLAYNRLPEVWGPDADQWRPERFLEGTLAPETSLGVFANLATFSSGVRGCIGWRFAVLEMQAILIEMLENFEFSPPPGDVEIILGPAGFMTPMIKGAKEPKGELPVTMTAL
ncbi:hypothetical protein M422DRAFT_275874 [Sphaerobolus stellatus SS14]|uniref:Cytochrome P450 n=1 Tax=Sphaerobolus stellatus (strain SS14) TaxID=990650 RepID=A0A0C9UEB9_SPHS4|nr:hypothetical protein M422DRAFT_275874 [Sphaerobolus stellatus SS14]